MDSSTTGTGAGEDRPSASIDDDSLGDDDSIGGILDSGTNREEIISSVGNMIEQDVEGQSVIRVQTKYHVWQSKLGLLDENNNGSGYVTNVLVQAESGSLAHDATFQTTLVNDNMSLKLVFRNEANDELPYGTKVLFQQLIFNEPDDGRTIATDFEDMMRSRSDNMTVRPISMMIVPLPFRGRHILKKAVYPVFIEGREIKGLRSRCTNCRQLDTSSPRVEPVPYHYVRIQEDREDTQRYQESEFSSAILSPSFKRRTQEGQEDTDRREAVDRQMREELEELQRDVAAREERARVAERECKEKTKRMAKQYAKAARAKRDADMEETEEIRRVQEEEHHELLAELKGKDIARKREFAKDAKEDEERIAKLVREKLAEMSLAATQSALAESAVSGNAELSPSTSTTNIDTNSSFAKSSLASAITAGTSHSAPSWVKQPTLNELRLRPINFNEQHPLTASRRVSPGKRKARENVEQHEDAGASDIVNSSPSKYPCYDSNNHLN